MTFYLIDGYNVLHELRKAQGKRVKKRAKGRMKEPGEEEKLDPAALEGERRRLVDRIAGYIASRGERAIIVFDSQKASLEHVHSTAPNVEVYFGSFSRSADAIIERQAYALKEEERLFVVTSDYEVQKTTFLANVYRRSSRQFVQDLQRYTTRLAKSADCTRMEHRVEERLDETSLNRLKRLRDQLGREPNSD